jgi:hypothetical protein
MNSIHGTTDGMECDMSLLILWNEAEAAPLRALGAAVDVLGIKIQCHKLIRSRFEKRHRTTAEMRSRTKNKADDQKAPKV